MRPFCRRSSRSRSWLSICWAASREPFLRHLLDLAHHALEIFLAHRLLVLVEARRHIHRRLALGLPHHLLHQLVQRLPQLLHQALDLLVGGAVLQRLGELLLQVAQPALGVGQVAVLEPQRDMPELVDDALEAGARVVSRLKTVVSRAQPEIGVRVADEVLGLAPSAHRARRAPAGASG